MRVQYRLFIAGAVVGLICGSLLTAGWQALPRVAAETDGPPPALQGADLNWLPKELDAAVERIEAQLRGMDVTMWEVGYRFDELYHAGQARNWPLAEYHLEKIEHTLNFGLERRPARAESAQPFMNEVLPEVAELVKQHDATAFERGMGRLRTGCMQCHVAEDVPHFIPDFPPPRPAPAPPNDADFWEAP